MNNAVMLSFKVKTQLNKPNELIKKQLDKINTGQKLEIIKNEYLDKYNQNDISEIIHFIKTNTLLEQFESIERHEIDKIKIEKWVNNQCCEKIKELAKIYKDTIIHIGNNKMLNAISKIADKIDKYYTNSIVILGPHKSKSNYFFTMLVMTYIFKKNGKLPKGYALNFVEAFEDYGFDVSYIDIDDMMYTGTQTLGSLKRYLHNDEPKGLNFKTDSNLSEKQHIEQIIIKRHYLEKNKLHYLLIRPFVSEKALELFEDFKNILIPFELIYFEKIPSFKNQIVKNENNIEQLLNYVLIIVLFNLGKESATNVYFDYKIADIASTCSFPLISGYIPSYDFIQKVGELEEKNNTLSLIIDYKIRKDLDKKLEQFFNERSLERSIDESSRSKHGPKFIPFITNCDTYPIFNDSFNEIEFQENYGILHNEDDEYINPDEKEEKDVNVFNICPKPFYKEKYNFGRKSRKSRKGRKSRRGRKIKNRKSHKKSKESHKK